jgi:hypothetical protein
MEQLTDDNFIMYAIKCYDKPACMMSEFEEDLQKIKYLKRLLRRYKNTGTLNERLILNHIIVLSNLFGPLPLSRMLFLKVDKSEHDILKTFLVFLNLMPVVIPNINGKNIVAADIPIDVKATVALRSI